jgi:hypothetical protein
MAEWLKAHAWKACILQKGIEGSNPSLSASFYFEDRLRHTGQTVTALLKFQFCRADPCQENNRDRPIKLIASAYLCCDGRLHFLMRFI